MPRPKPINPATKQFAIRITDDMDELIDRLVALDAEDHEESPNRTAWFNRLVRREARYRRLLPEKGSAHAAGVNRPAPATKGRASGEPPGE